MEEYKELQNFISNCSSGPVQKSDEWYQIKQKTIGGSEISTILGSNPFSDVKKLVAEKLNITGYKFNGNISTRWGNLFEFVTKTITELLLKTNIHEMPSIEGKIPGQRYSPDGVGIVRLLGVNNVRSFYKVLFEFKSPMSTWPKECIPSHYIPQVKTGLSTLDIVDIAIFVNCCFRKCKISDLGFNSSYDVEFHSQDFKKRKNGLNNVEPYAYGIISFYQTEELYNKTHNALFEGKYYDDFDNEDSDLIINSIGEPIDFGKSNYKQLNRLLQLVDNKQVAIEYSDIKLNQQVINKNKFIKNHRMFNVKDISTNNNNIDYNDLIIENGKKNKYFMGYLPWKLMLIDIIEMERDHNWLDFIKPKIEEVLKLINELSDSNDVENKFNEKFSSVYTEDMTEELNIMNELL